MKKDEIQKLFAGIRMDGNYSVFEDNNSLVMEIDFLNDRNFAVEYLLRLGYQVSYHKIGIKVYSRQ